MIIEEMQFKRGTVGESILKLHQRLGLLGFAVSAEELQKAWFGPGSEAAIRQFQVVHGLPPHGMVDAVTARGLGLGGYPSSVAGLVCRPDGTPLPDVAVQLCQPAISGQVIAETRSDPSGRFSLAWPAGVVGDLIVRADGSADQPISWRMEGVSDTVWITLGIGGEYRGPSRFALLTAALAPTVAAGTFHAVGGAGRAAEIEAIGRGTGVPAADVSRHVLAHKLAAKTKIAPEVFFTLLTQHVMPELQASLDPATGSSAALDDVYVDHVLDLALLRTRCTDPTLKATRREANMGACRSLPAVDLSAEHTWRPDTHA